MVLSFTKMNDDRLILHIIPQYRYYSQPMHIFMIIAYFLIFPIMYFIEYLLHLFWMILVHLFSEFDAAASLLVMIA